MCDGGTATVIRQLMRWTRACGPAGRRTRRCIRRRPSLLCPFAVSVLRYSSLPSSTLIVGTVPAKRRAVWEGRTNRRAVATCEWTSVGIPITRVVVRHSMVDAAILCVPEYFSAVSDAAVTGRRHPSKHVFATSAVLFLRVPTALDVPKVARRAHYVIT
jgi:hypothetical protein